MSGHLSDSLEGTSIVDSVQGTNKEPGDPVALIHGNLEKQTKPEPWGSL